MSSRDREAKLRQLTWTLRDLTPEDRDDILSRLSDSERAKVEAQLAEPASGPISPRRARTVIKVRGLSPWLSQRIASRVKIDRKAPGLHAGLSTRAERSAGYQLTERAHQALRAAANALAERQKAEGLGPWQALKVAVERRLPRSRLRATP